MHFARSIVLGYHSIPKIKWGSFRGRREEKWGSFRGRFGDHFRVGDHFGVGIISGAVQAKYQRVLVSSTTRLVAFRARARLSCSNVYNL